MLNDIEPNIFSPVKHRYSLALNEIIFDIPEILDVGGYQSRANIVSDYFSNYIYKSVNIGSAWYKNEQADYIYNGLDLPFKDNSYDFVISIDTIEHVPSENRVHLMLEMIRVAKKRAIIVVPFREIGCDSNESYLLDISKQYGIKPMPSLQEHEKYGLPTYEQLQQFTDTNKGVLKLATNRQDYWSVQMAMLWNTIALNGDSVELNRKLQEFQELFLNKQEAPIHVDDAYRCILVFDKEV